MVGIGLPFWGYSKVILFTWQVESSPLNIDASPLFYLCCCYRFRKKSLATGDSSSLPYLIIRWAQQHHSKLKVLANPWDCLIKKAHDHKILCHIKIICTLQQVGDFLAKAEHVEINNWLFADCDNCASASRRQLAAQTGCSLEASLSWLVTPQIFSLFLFLSFFLSWMGIEVLAAV
jgi:hypothetical protein